MNRKPYYQELFNINPLNFYYDPYQNGLKDNSGSFRGSFDIKLTKSQVKENQKSGYFYSNSMITVGDNSISEDMQEQMIKEQITRDITRSKKPDDLFELYRWFTWYEGTLYYLEFDDNTVYTCRKCKEFFGYEKDPYVFYQTRKNAYRLYNISPVMEQIQMFQSQEKLLSYAVENSEQAANPVRYINQLVVPDAMNVRYLKGVDIGVSTTGDLNNAITHQKPGDIKSGFDAFNLIGQIQQNQSGVGPGLKGMSDQDKVGIYEGNIEQAADLFSLDDKMLESAERKLGWLFEQNVRNNMDGETSVMLLGADKSITQIMLSSKNIHDEDEYAIQIIATSSEEQSSSKTQANKMAALNSVIPIIQQMPVIAEKMLSISGFEDQEIQSIMETDQTKSYSDFRAKVDLALILTGSKPIYKRYADNSYFDTLKDYVKKNADFLSVKHLKTLTIYLEEAYQYFIENEHQKAQDTLNTQQELQMDAMNQQVGQDGQPVDPNTPPDAQNATQGAVTQPTQPTMPNQPQTPSLGQPANTGGMPTKVPPDQSMPLVP